jgi:hypothetical protein
MDNEHLIILINKATLRHTKFFTDFDRFLIREDIIENLYDITKEEKGELTLLLERNLSNKITAFYFYNKWIDLEERILNRFMEDVDKMPDSLPNAQGPVITLKDIKRGNYV